MYYYALATGDAKALLRSYNGYQTNICKYMPSGDVYACFTPDYLPHRLRRFEVMHSYPQTSDVSIVFYLWPRIAQTWMRSAAIIDPNDVGYLSLPGSVVLGARVLSDGDILEIEPTAPFFDRLFWMDSNICLLRIRTDKDVEILHCRNDVEIRHGKRLCEQGTGTLVVAPIDGYIELF